MDKITIEETLKRNKIKLSDREIAEKLEQYQAKIKEENCSICQQKFTRENIQKGHFTKEIKGCGHSQQINYYHPECWQKQEQVKEEEQKERTNNPLLFAKVERLERELEQIRKSVEK